MRVGKTYEFHAAHHLPNHPTCGSPHGHSYRLEVEISGPVQNGMVIDFGTLSDVVVKPILVNYDHTNLNEHIKYPSAENLVEQLKREISSSLSSVMPDIGVVRLRLWETSTAYAEWRIEDSRA